MYIVALLFRIIPANLLSFLTGWLSRVELPGVSQLLNQGFVKIFGINMAEAELPLDQYRTIEHVFTRRLKDDARSIASGDMVSPCDGRLVAAYQCDCDTAIQAKGLTYSLTDLITGKEDGDLGSGRKPHWYTTIYLAPHNYHRVHSPVSGRVKKVTYIPGNLWPVNIPFVRVVPRLFARNERLVFEIALEGGGTVWQVMVGSFNVGRMSTHLIPDFATNDASRQLGVAQQSWILDETIAKGDELGVFMLGSTVILVVDSSGCERLVLDRIPDSKVVRMGESMGATINDHSAT